jgi:Glycosyltransferase family 87
MALWLSALAVACVRSLLFPKAHTVYPTFVAAGKDWCDGVPLYFRDRGAGYEIYRYSPPATVLLTPLHLIPLGLGGALWRMLNAALFVGGLRWWLRQGVPVPLSERQIGWALLIAMPLALGSLNNGQPNLLVIGLLLMAVTASAQARWWLAAGCLTVATMLKAYPIAVGLLIVVCNLRSLAPRLLLCLAAVALVPFACQDAGYVADRYGEWLRALTADDRKYWPPPLMYRDLWLLLREFTLPITPHGYLAIQILTATGCAALCWQLRQHQAQSLTAALGLGTCWMMLCGPATESSTYAMLGPALAYAVLIAPVEPWPAAVRRLPTGSLCLFWLSAFAGALPWAASIHALGIQPLGALALSAAYVGWAWRRRPRETAQPHASPERRWRDRSFSRANRPPADNTDAPPNQDREPVLPCATSGRRSDQSR